MNSWEYRFILWDGVDQNEFLSFVRNQMGKIEGFKVIESSKKSIQGFYNHHNLGNGKVNLKISQTPNGVEVSLKAVRVNKTSAVRNS